MRAKTALACSISSALVLVATRAFAQDPPAKPPGGSVEATATPLTVAQALDRLKQENLALAAAKYDLSAARAGVIAAGVLPNPGLSFGAHFLTHGARTGGEEDVSVVLDQVLPIGGQVGLRKDVAEQLSGAAEHDFAALAWSLAYEARVAYLDLQAAQARVRVLADGVADLDRVDAVIEARATAGANPQYDRVRVSVEKSNLAGRVAEAQAELAAARGALARAVGPSVDARAVVAAEDLGEPSDPPKDAKALVALGVTRRHEIAAARQRTSAGDIRVDYIKRSYVPSPDLAVGYTRWFGVATPTGNESGGTVYAGVSLPIPLFDHGQGSVDRGRAEAESVRARQREIEVAVQREIEVAAQNAIVRVEAWKKYRDATASGVDRLRDIAQLSYKEGHATILELLDAFSTSLSVRQRALELRAGAARANLELERAVGGR